MNQRRTDANCYTPWTRDEHDFVVSEFDGSHATTEVIAELLGRTAKAVEAHFYAVRAGKAERPLSNEKPLATHRTASAYRRTLLAAAPYIGAADEPGDDWWSAAAYKS